MNKGAYPELSEKARLHPESPLDGGGAASTPPSTPVSRFSQTSLSCAMADGRQHVISGEEVVQALRYIRLPDRPYHARYSRRKASSSVDEAPLQGAHGRAEDPRTLRESEHLRMERRSRRPFSLPFRRRSSPVIPKPLPTTRRSSRSSSTTSPLSAFPRATALSSSTRRLSTARAAVRSATAERSTTRTR